MSEFSAEAMGLVIREHHQARNASMTQEEREPDRAIDETLRYADRDHQVDRLSPEVAAPHTGGPGSDGGCGNAR
ncbi:hypothetical protein ACWGE1_05760 [Streptomyces sp. NPDC054932]